MDSLSAVLLGLVEGLTEFLPISSTGHLIALSHYLQIENSTNHQSFQIIIQLAAILALLGIYREKFSLKYFDLWLKVFIAFLPIALLGYLFSDWIKILFSIEVVAIMFIVGGVVFLWVEYLYRQKPAKTNRLEKITIRQAIIIGLGQVFALIPGTSRAGSSIVFAMLVGINRKISTEFSFLLALPVLLAASSYEFISNFAQFEFNDIKVLVIGFVISFISAYAALKLLLKYLNYFSFIPFAIYRIVFGIILLTII